MQEIVPEGEWDEFMSTLRRKLPTTIRIASHGGQVVLLCNQYRTGGSCNGATGVMQ